MDNVNPSVAVYLHFAGRYQGRDAVRPHRHGCCELVLVRRGRCRFRVGSWIEPAAAGDVALLPPNLAHDQRDRTSVVTDYLGWTGAMLRTIYAPRILHLPDADPARQWIADLVAIAQRGDRTWAAVSDDLLRATLNRLALLGAFTELPTWQPAVRALHEAMLEHLERPAPVAAVARTYGISPSALALRYQREVGVPPVRAHLRHRLEHARLLMADPHRSIADVGRAVGFADANYFGRAFRKRFGASPGRLRAHLLHANRPPVE